MKKKNIFVNCWLHSICTRYLRSSIVSHRMPCRRCTAARPSNYIVGEHIFDSLATKNAAKLSELSVSMDPQTYVEGLGKYIWQKLFGTDISRFVTFECNELCQPFANASALHMWKTDTDVILFDSKTFFKRKMPWVAAINITCVGRSGGRREAEIEEEVKILYIHDRFPSNIEAKCSYETNRMNPSI